ncbi:hypothetical protein Moror_17794 [Moniliophthora roreri MCA 2997]|uniref:F-box domain-containing protein n=2 Tax=Moniliophthora roreri TaxID=221103 RepID=V2XDU1_MONRO|nr:hypothetical protein Moror_17794 [Moniliophthora roreri MCA 2997]
MTMSRTLTVTRAPNSRPRRLSLSLITPRAPPPLLNLPAELVFEILELSLQTNKPSNITTVCKTISSFLDIILYRTVVLNSNDTVNLFYRTTLSKTSSFLSTHVKHVVLTFAPDHSSLQFRRIRDILPACTGLRSLSLPSGYELDSALTLVRAVNSDVLSELIVHSHEGLLSQSRLGLQQHSVCNASLSHLRISEPGDGFISPRSVLSSFGPLPHLTHLQLSRRINSNEQNDRLFIDDLDTILKDRPDLKVLVVSIFPLPWTPAGTDVTQSSIWNMVESLAMLDRRLVLRKGEYKEWDAEWDGVRRANMGEASDFWTSVRNEMVVL